VPELAHHLAEHASAGRTGLVFVGARGGVLRRNNFRRIWLRALDSTGLGDVHFHDLRHTGNTLAATGGATRRCGPRWSISTSSMGATTRSPTTWTVRSGR
jgi:integrase